MKNFKLITCIIFCMLSIKVNAQVIVWEKAVDSVNTYNYYGQFSNQIVAKRISNDNILLLQQFIVDSTSFAYNQVRYDSLKIDKFTINGQRKWTKKYPLTNGGFVKDFIETTDKHILLLIELGINNTVVKLDSNGTILTIKNFLNTDSLLRLSKIVDTKDGNFLILSKRSIYEFDDQNCWWWWWYSFTKGYNTKTYLTKINSNLNILWNKQLTDNYIHTFDLGYSYQMVELFPTTIDVLDDNNHSINIIHQVKEGYDLVNQLKLERYTTNGDKEFEKVLLDSITTAEACSYGMNFSILRWKDNYISEAS
ncbi:MAG TPA: hypothetical protein PK431_03505, partial [Chitinophagales bacterium]|nr:hypothetical protein [Chitinophagales bacterium]